MIKKILLVSLLCSICFLNFHSARAEDVTFKFFGYLDYVVVSGDARWFYNFNTGDPFELAITYDPLTADTGGNYYFSNISFPEYYFGAGTESFTTPLESRITILNDSPGTGDEFLAQVKGYSQPSTYDGFWDINLLMNDQSAAVFSNTALPGYFDINSFNSTQMQFSQALTRNSFTTGQTITFGNVFLQGRVRQIQNPTLITTPTTTPEPASLFMLGAGGFAVGLAKILKRRKK